MSWLLMQQFVAHRRGFTLIELLLVIGVIAILAGVVITAVNPLQNLIGSQDAKRRSFTRELQNAAYQYLIDTGNEPGDKNIPNNEDSALPVCRRNLPGPNCIGLDDLIPDYIGEFHNDPAEPDPNYTGYEIYLERGSFIRVRNRYLGSGSTTITLSDIFAGGAGTVLDPYQLENCAQLQNADNFLSSSFVMNRSINCDLPPYNTGEGFNPIGNSTTNYSGTFDGQGYRIVGLYINRSSENNVGLFSRIENNSVFSFGLIDVNLIGNVSVGAITGDSIGTATMTNIYATGQVQGAAEVGGLVGENSGTLDSSYAAVNIGGAGGGSVGGLVGMNSDTVTASYYDSTNLECALCLETTGALAFDNLISQSYLQAQGWNFTIAWEANTGTYPTLRY